MRKYGVAESEIKKRQRESGEEEGGGADDGATLCHPDNWLALQVFRALGTQWRVGTLGQTLRVWGLGYEALPGVMDMLGVRRKDRADVFWALQQMESEALKVFNKNG